MSVRATRALVLSLGLVPLPAASEEAVDLSMVTRIREEGFGNSKVMETLGYLCDVIGPRVTGSPQMKRANEWARQQLESWGLANAHLESWGPFGPGWTLEHVSVHMVSPDAGPLTALPRAWTPGTRGPVQGRAVKVKIESEADFDAYRGKLAGAVVFAGEAREVKGQATPLTTRYSEGDLDELSRYDFGPPRHAWDRAAAKRRLQLLRAFGQFLASEKALAVVAASALEGGVVQVGRAADYKTNERQALPSLVMAVEHYNRVVRLLDRKQDVQLELDVRTTFHDRDPMAYNTIAEIPGTDRKGEVVMLGAHMDSWHAGTGATDNAAGVAAAMEAVRILKALDVKPRRTIRVALWSGEEQGLLGSEAYVMQHFASRSKAPDGQRDGARARGALVPKPEYDKLSAYFNLDNGSGKIRGVYLQGNAAAAPIFEAWLKPFGDLGARTLTMRSTEGTDHGAFDDVGLPGFQFIQDELDYTTRTHHTNLDVYERLQREDMLQASAIVASFAYNAAMREGMIPRKPLAKETTATGAGSPH